MRLEGKRAVVTGAGIGIGRETALELARQGSDVVLSYHSSADGAETAIAEIKAMGREAAAIQADLGMAADCFRLIDAAVDTLGGLDILVNNAGRTDTTPFLHVTPELFDRIFDINIRGQFFCAQRAAQQMRAQGGGVILNMTSVHALASMPNYSVYDSTKGAIASWTRAIAIELAPHKIRVNAIAPGAIEVPRYYARENYSSEEMGSRIPWGAVGYPEDVAHLCAFLASDEAAYITGATIVVDGGLTARLALFTETFNQDGI